ncbi:MAG: HAD family hydrolase [bacterium]|nr:HAD family hydrolase [bacterium]
MENRKKLIIFDLDGTLYKLKGGSFKRSGIYKEVLKNTEQYIIDKLNKTKREAKLILKKIIKEYDESISIGLEEKFKIDRYAYFNATWNISAQKYIKINLGLRTKLLKIKNNFDLALVSDAPRVWIKNVLKELKIENIFTDNNIFSGEGNIRKEFGNAFNKIIKVLNIKPEYCIAIGDQEETDIIPAKKIGIKTILINRRNKTGVADYVIKDISELKKLLDIII